MGRLLKPTSSVAPSRYGRAVISESYSMVLEPAGGARPWLRDQRPTLVAAQVPGPVMVKVKSLTGPPVHTPLQPLTGRFRFLWFTSARRLAPRGATQLACCLTMPF